MSACRPLPPAALVPLAILWLGIGNSASISLVAFVAIWPVLINTIAGIENVPRVLREVALTMGADTKHLIITVLIPAAFPSIVLGMRLAMGLAWMSVVLSELVGVQHGVGALLLSLQQNDDVAAMLLIVLLIGMLGLLLDWLFRTTIQLLTRSQKGVLIT
jgi:ABC-type nitrate/sulfonate/bicarbonate transport system permease component